jgi:hypothetical protein
MVSALAQRRSAQKLRDRCTISRETASGMVTIAVDVPCYLDDQTLGALTSDVMAGEVTTLAVTSIHVAPGTDIKRGDRLSDIVQWNGRTHPVFTAGHIAADTGSPTWVVRATVEESAITEQVVSFYRDDANGNLLTLGPYIVQVDLANTVPNVSAGEGAIERTIGATLHGPETMDVLISDWCSAIYGRVGGYVVEITPPNDGTKDVRVRLPGG